MGWEVTYDMGRCILLMSASQWKWLADFWRELDPKRYPLLIELADYHWAGPIEEVYNELKDLDAGEFTPVCSNLMKAISDEYPPTEDEVFLVMSNGEDEWWEEIAALGTRRSRGFDPAAHPRDARGRFVRRSDRP